MCPHHQPIFMQCEYRYCNRDNLRDVFHEIYLIAGFTGGVGKCQGASEQKCAFSSLTYVTIQTAPVGSDQTGSFHLTWAII